MTCVRNEVKLEKATTRGSRGAADIRQQDASGTASSILGKVIHLR
jgi:hypothetical protein